MPPIKKRLRRYKGLTLADQEYLAKFDKAVTGRARKSVCDSLGMSDATRKELYRDRYRALRDAGYRPKVIRFSLNEGSAGADPSDAIIEALDKKKKLQISPLQNETGIPKKGSKLTH